MHHEEQRHYIKAGHAWAMDELSILHKCLKAIKMLCEENHALKHSVASADELHETVVHLEAEVEAMCVEHEVWCVSPFIHLYISSMNLTGGIRVRNMVSEGDFLFWQPPHLWQKLLPKKGVIWKSRIESQRYFKKYYTSLLLKHIVKYPQRHPPIHTMQNDETS
jgi:hypothetical protein